MNINELTVSKFLKKEDVSPPIIVTISGLTRENLAKENEAPEMKYVLQFSEALKPMVLNLTNGKLIAMVTGEEDTDNWVGKQITLWNDPTVSFGEKMTGGIRVQMPQAQAVAAPAVAQAQAARPAVKPDERNPPDNFDDDIPF
jgi:hypothetical protein